MTHTVRVYGSDEASGNGVALLEEHDFTGLDEASECARQLERAGAGLVTLNAEPKFVIKSTVHDRWMWTYSGITTEEAQEIADTLGRAGEAWTVEPVG